MHWRAGTLLNPIPLKIASYLPAWLINISVSLVYLSLTTFLMFFNRHLIAKFMYFYWTFHFVSTGLAIWFSGLLVFWLIFMPIWRFFETLHIFYDPSVSGEKVLGRLLKHLILVIKSPCRKEAVTFGSMYTARKFSKAHRNLPIMDFIAYSLFPLGCKGNLAVL